MDRGIDSLLIKATDVFGVTRFDDLENIEIQDSAYAGLSRYSEGSVEMGGVEIGARDYDSSFGGLELRSHGFALHHGINMHVLGGLGLQSGKAGI